MIESLSCEEFSGFDGKARHRGRGIGWLSEMGGDLDTGLVQPIDNPCRPVTGRWRFENYEYGRHL